MDRDSLATRPTGVRVRVPATSANLGPGYDALGLALSWYDEVELTVTRTPGVRVEVVGEGADSVSLDETHLVAKAAYAAFDRLGWRPTGLMLSCRNAVPHARGLGSSAAAIVAGVLGASVLAGEPRGQARLTGCLRLATELEGHPDNVAACLLGGATVAWTDSGAARAVRLQPHPDLHAIAFVPSSPSSTVAARGVIPAEVPHREAALNAGRAALLTHALTTDPSLLFPATEDWLHQRYRADSMPTSSALVARLRADGVPAVISGAGGTVLALVAGKGDDLAKYVREADQTTVLPLVVDLSGAVAHPLPDE